jgi:hypothetical protein
MAVRIDSSKRYRIFMLRSGIPIQTLYSADTEDMAQDMIDELTSTAPADLTFGYEDSQSDRGCDDECWIVEVFAQERELIGPFPTDEEASAWAMRWLPAPLQWMTFLLSPPEKKEE